MSPGREEAVDGRENAHFTNTPVDSPSDGAEFRLARVRVVLCQTTHPGNIGAAARAMKAMGLSRLYLVRPARFPDPEAVARASGADDLLANAVICESLAEALAGVNFAAALTARQREIGPPAATAREAAVILAERTAGGEVALVFGREANGLANEEVMQCDLCVKVPTNPAFSSLNLGSAVQLLSYEMRQAIVGDTLARTPVTPFSSAPATRDDVERLFEHFERTMAATGFFDPKNPKRLMPKLRRMFGRGGLEVDEINILRGFLASVEAAIDRGPAKNS